MTAVDTTGPGMTEPIVADELLDEADRLLGVRESPASGSFITPQPSGPPSFEAGTGSYEPRGYRTGHGWPSPHGVRERS